MLTEQRNRRVLEHLHTRLQETVCGGIVLVIHVVCRQDSVQCLSFFPADHVRKLFVITYDYGIHGTRQRQRTSLYVHLWCLIHNHIVKDHILADATFGGISSAEHDRIFFQKLLGFRFYVFDGESPPFGGLIAFGHLAFQHQERCGTQFRRTPFDVDRLQRCDNGIQLLLYFSLTGNIIGRFQARNHFWWFTSEKREHPCAQWKRPLQPKPKVRFRSVFYLQLIKIEQFHQFGRTFAVQPLFADGFLLKHVIILRFFQQSVIFCLQLGLVCLGIKAFGYDMKQVLCLFFYRFLFYCPITHIRIIGLIGDESLLILHAAQFGHNKVKIFPSEFFLHILNGRIVVRYDQHCFICQQQIGNDV